jgi:MFS family permease
LPVEDSEEHKSSLKNFLNEFVVFFRILKNNFTEVLILLVILSFDALIWTYGALWSIERFGQESNWIVTTIYQACMIFGSIFLLKFNFRRVEKGFVTLSIFVAMLVLNLIFVFNTAANADFLVLLVAGSLIFSFGFPLIYSIFTTIAQNNKKEAEEIIGLRRIVYGLSYIIAPIVGGFILHNHTYNYMFGVMWFGFSGISALAFGIYVVQKLLHMNDVLK